VDVTGRAPGHEAARTPTWGLGHTDASRGGGVGGSRFLSKGTVDAALIGTRSPAGTGSTARAGGSGPVGRAAKANAGASLSQSSLRTGTASGIRSLSRCRLAWAHSGQPHLPGAIPHLHTCSCWPPSSLRRGPSAGPSAAGTAIEKRVARTHASTRQRRSARDSVTLVPTCFVLGARALTCKCGSRSCACAQGMRVRRGTTPRRTAALPDQTPVWRRPRAPMTPRRSRPRWRSCAAARRSCR